MLNLLANAIKFTPADSVALRVVYLDGKPGHASSLAIEVRDTGIGIPPDRQRRIFEPYQCIEPPGSRRVNDSGPGLSIRRERVDLMNAVEFAKPRFGMQRDIGDIAQFSQMRRPRNPVRGPCGCGEIAR